MQPKVFISYSWTSPGHQSVVLQWAEQLVADGIDVVLDIWDLKEGDDKFVFMERMVTDPNVTHVLMICDKSYSEKADARKAGVGTESQIISREIYEKVAQSKFIPIACEFSDDGTPFLPTFLKSRIWIDFSSLEAANENWERLVRVLFGKPQHAKPTLGKPPPYIENATASPPNPATIKFNAFRQALLQNKKGIAIYRRDFLLACTSHIGAIQSRERPEFDSPGKRILADCAQLKHVRNNIIDWLLLESESSPTEEFCDALLTFLEKLRAPDASTGSTNSWSDTWAEAYSLFVYETFLYIVAALVKTNACETLHELLTAHYLLSDSERRGGNQFDTFSCFYRNSDTLQPELAPAGKKLFSTAAELIKRQADREDVPFSSIIEADLLILLMAFTNEDVRFWYPQTLHYAQYHGQFPLFIRATQHRHFLKLAKIVGIPDVDQLRKAVREGHKRLGVSRWHNFYFDDGFWSSMNMDELDSLK